MYKQKFGISLGNTYKVKTEQVIKIVADCKFDAVSPEWNHDYDIEKIAKTAYENNLALQSLHAPFGGSAALWSDDKEASQEALKQLFDSLTDAENYGIPILVAHAWIGFENLPKPSDTGISNYEKLVNKAEQCGVKIAFENTEGDEFLETLMNHFKGCDTVGFCWDSGHEMCYNHSEDLLGKYGDRLIMTHVNDNLGISRFDGKVFWTDDLHLLPFDGVADWDYNAERLKKCTIPEFLNFELNIQSKPERHENDKYARMALEDYFTEAYIRACRIVYKLH